MTEVAVVGSLHMDLVVRTPRAPHPGETVLGVGHRWVAGGKGGNQAVAAARLGRSVAMVGAVGRDEHGRTMVAELRAEGVDVSCVAVDDQRPSGLAVVVVDDVGENSIVVSAGASGALSVEHVQAAAPLLRAAAVTLLSLEVPLDAVLAGAELAGGAVVLNPAPARPLPPALLRRVEVLVPNRGELAALTGGAVTSEQDVVRSARALDGPRAVLVTLGADGAVLVSGREVLRVPAPTVPVVDTTGAGDALCGALADALARGGTLAAATEHAVAVAAQSVAHAGARGVVRPSGA